MTVQVLLVDDSPGDVRLTREAFDETVWDVQLHVAVDGVDAMTFLRHQGPHADAPVPDLILLDLNLPRLDGRQVLARIKSDKALKSIPTIILTTSAADADVTRAYELKANAYLSKPVRLDSFERLVKSIGDFWLIQAKLPHQLSG